MIDADIATKHYGIRTSVLQEPRAVSSLANVVVSRVRGILTATPWAEIAWVFAAYFVAGKLGQATTNIRSSNLGPVWPAYGIAVASLLAYGYRVWPGIAASAFLIAYLSPVPALAALGQAAGATTAAAIATFSVRRIPHFDPKLSRLRDAIAFITRAALGSAVVSSTIGVTSLYLTHVQAYSGLGSAWVIYWLGDSTGVLLVTPLVFTLPTLLTGRFPPAHGRTRRAGDSLRGGMPRRLRGSAARSGPAPRPGVCRPPAGHVGRDRFRHRRRRDVGVHDCHHRDAVDGARPGSIRRQHPVCRRGAAGRALHGARRVRSHAGRGHRRA